MKIRDDVSNDLAHTQSELVTTNHQGCRDTVAKLPKLVTGRDQPPPHLGGLNI